MSKPHSCLSPTTNILLIFAWAAVAALFLFVVEPHSPIILAVIGAVLGAIGGVMQHLSFTQATKGFSSASTLLEVRSAFKASTWGNHYIRFLYFSKLILIALAFAVRSFGALGRMKSQRLMFLVIVALCTDGRAETTNSFGIYLPSEPVDRRITAHGQGDWSRIRLPESPLISAADIVSYDFADHSIRLRSETLAKIPRPPVEGTPFVVVADGQRIYPRITVPAGHLLGLPFGLSFIGCAYGEPILLKIALAFEPAAKVRTPPRFLPTVG